MLCIRCFDVQRPSLLLLSIVALQANLLGQSSLVNVSHLHHLTERIAYAGDSVEIVHVYANYPTYEWVDAKESGPEGIACVDDAARAAVLYLCHYESTRSPESITRARLLLKFVMHMQADDGQFYNFIFADRTINTTGQTSYKSFGWWAARGVWCMALGARVLRPVDSAFAAELARRVERTFPHIEHLLARYDSVRIVGGFRVPQWLLYESAADATSELLLGLNEYYAATRDQRVRRYIELLAEGLMIMQDGTASAYPFGLHRSWQTVWHAWGNCQTQALAHAGRLLGDNAMIASAEREAIGWYSRVLIDGMLKEVDVSNPASTTRFEQIAYGIRPMTVGLLRLYEATHKREYRVMAALAASWLFGNNVLRRQMYDPHTGRCFDGLTDSATVNKNSGAESTIEALLTLVELERFPETRRYLSFKNVHQGRTSRFIYGVFEDPTKHELTLVLDVQRSNVTVLEGRHSRAFRQRYRSQDDR